MNVQIVNVYQLIATYAFQMASIPIIDLSLSDKLIKKSLQHAMSSVGFFYIKNHGIDSEEINTLSKLFHNFFELPIEEKKKLRMELAGLAWRGWFPLHGEMTSGKPDRKEGYYFGTECQIENLKPRLMRGKNLWPDSDRLPKNLAIPDLKPRLLKYLEDLTKLAQKLLSFVALSLELERDYFLKRFTSDPTVLFRAFIYPPGGDPEEWGVAEHTDMGFLTILKQDDSGGLEVYNKTSETWVSAPPIENTFVVNIGDMLERWTHGIYVATPHRVRNVSGKLRLSMPFFFDPNWDCELEPIDKDLLKEEVLELRTDGKERWDGMKMKSLDGKMTYGHFVDGKITKCFPFLREQE